ncbi:MAG: NADH-quinone oxidoreductase subunit F, partial [Candidatus Eisenbacteria bacterium]|nr:NADH-quinone oxidoreductase subunit F [Candidatus Eisenbacteria bacterium]
MLTKYRHEKDCHTLDFYRGHGGYEQAKKAIQEWKPDDLIEEVKKSNLRGRGGAGFPTGVKWGFVPKQTDKPKYLAVNADESEPGTFKDRVIIETNPHLLLEGITIASWAVGIHNAYIYIRGELVFGYRQLVQAVKEAYAAGLLGKGLFGSGFDLDVTV